MNRVKSDSHPVRFSHTFLVLLVSSRMIVGNALTDPIPSEVGNLSALGWLHLCEWASINRVKNDSLRAQLSHFSCSAGFLPNDSQQFVDWFNT
jgi:hypothetical protein